MNLNRKIRTSWLVIVVLGIVLVADGSDAAETDSIVFAQRLTRDLYLRPLDVDRASLRIEVDRFDVGQEPHAFLVHVYQSSEPSAAEILTVHIVRVRTFLQYVAASGALLKSTPTDKALRERRINISVNVLGELGAYRTDGKKYRATRAGFVELRFVHSDPPSHVSDMTTGVFDDRTGLLRMFGTPAVPPDE